MIKNEIREIFVSFGDIKELRATVPFSVGSVVEENYVSEKSFTDTSVTLKAYTTFDKTAADGEYIYLRFRAVEAGTEIDFNGESLGRVDEYRELLTYDITSAVREGVNTLELRTRADDILDVGVFDAIEVIRTSYAIIDKVTVSQTHEEGRVTLSIKLDTLGCSDNVRAVATLMSGSGQIYYGGITRGRGSITVTDPLYWWPKGLGVQNLYKLSVNVYGDMEVEDGVEMRIGLRTLTTAKSADGSLFEINGISFVPMGLTYRTPKKRYVENAQVVLESQIAAAARAGANTLVIPADSAIPRDKLFELCDLHGIVAVRECRSIAAEKDALSRLSYHASVGIVDIVEAGEDVYAITEELRRINHGFEFSVEDSAAKYPLAKSLACYRTLCECLSADERNPLSERVESDSEGDIVSMISHAAEKYLYASNIYDLSYVSQLVEADLAEQTAIRARIARGKGSRAVFSSLGRTVGVVGDGLLDCSLRHKAVSYKAARFFSPILLYARMAGTVAEFYASNESRTSFIGTLEYNVMDSENNVIFHGEENCTVDFSSSKMIIARDLGEYISGHEREYYLECSLRSGSNTVSKRTLLFVEPKRFAYKNPNIKAEIAGSDKKYSITLCSEAFAQGVEIDFIGSDVVLHDNFVDITSKAPIKLSFTVLGGITTAEKLQSELRIKSLYDIGKAYI